MNDARQKLSAKTNVMVAAVVADWDVEVTDDDGDARGDGMNEEEVEANVSAV